MCIGHLLYELACGECLTDLLPNDLTFEKVADPELRDALQLIFKAKWKRTNKKTIKQVLRNSIK